MQKKPQIYSHLHCHLHNEFEKSYLYLLYCDINKSRSQHLHNLSWHKVCNLLLWEVLLMVPNNWSGHAFRQISEVPWWSNNDCSADLVPEAWVWQSRWRNIQIQTKFLKPVVQTAMQMTVINIRACIPVLPLHTSSCSSSLAASRHLCRTLCRIHWQEVLNYPNLSLAVSLVNLAFTHC